MRHLLLVVCFVPHRGVHLRAVRRWGADATDRLFVLPPPEFAVKRIQPGHQAPQGTAVHLAAVESNVFAKLGSLVAHCSVVRYDDGEARRPGWFTVKTMGAAWVIQVKDPDACASLTATASSLDDALALADLLLSADSAPWEPDPFLKRTQKK